VKAKFKNKEKLRHVLRRLKTKGINQEIKINNNARAVVLKSIFRNKSLSQIRLAICNLMVAHILIFIQRLWRYD